MAIVKERASRNEPDYAYATRVIEGGGTPIYEDENCWVYDTSYILKKYNGRHTMEIACHIGCGDRCVADTKYLENYLWHCREKLKYGRNPRNGWHFKFNREIVGCTSMEVDEATEKEQRQTIENVLRFLNNLELSRGDESEFDEWQTKRLEEMKLDFENSK
jgi:hypothetical protein